MQVLAEIRDTVLALKPILRLANINDKNIDKMLVLLTKVEKEEQLVEFLNWLKSVQDGPAKEVRDIYSLKPPEWWVNMGMFGVEHTREFRLLNAAKKKLRAAWRTRYQTRAEDDEDQGDSATEDSDGVQVQSVEARTNEGHRTD